MKLIASHILAVRMHLPKHKQAGPDEYGGRVFKVRNTFSQA